MKKILSLLSLLVMTLTAFATDYTGHRTVTYGSNEPTESDNAVVSIVDNGDGTYNVSFVDVINVDGPYRDNYGTYTFGLYYREWCNYIHRKWFDRCSYSF